jgi:AcrR family transcriptional regulator
MRKTQVRRYNGKSRTEQATELKERVLNLTIKLLVKHKQEFSLRKLAQKADCSERHLYRIFDGLEGLSQELNRKMNKILGLDKDLKTLKTNELPLYAQTLFSKFNQNSELIKAYLGSPLGSFSRQKWLEEKHKYISELFAGCENANQLVKETSVILSASFWMLLRSEAHMSEEESINYINKLAIQIAESARKGSQK